MNQKQKLLSTTNTAVLIVIVLGFIGLFNYLGSTVFFRLDLTEGKEFTISKSTKGILKELDDIIRVEVFVSQKLPHQFLEIKNRVMDLLKEYEIYSKGNLKVSYIDPAQDKEQESRVRSLGVPQVQANIIEKDQRQTVNIFFGLGVFFEDKKEVIPVIQNLASLEYDLTSAIKKVATSEVRKVGILAGHGEHNIYEDYQEVRKALEKQYEVRNIETKNGTKIPDDIHTIVSAGSDTLPQRDLFEIDQFLMRGGKALFLVDEVDQGQNLQARKVTSNLNNILNAYGVRVNQNFVLDMSREMAGFNMGFYTMSIPYFLWPRIIKQNLAPDNHITEKLEVLSLPWISSVTNTVPSADSSRVFTALAKTTEHGWVMNYPFDMNPQRQHNPTSRQVQVVAALLEGEFKSAFTGQSVPQVEEQFGDSTIYKEMPGDAGRQVIGQSPKSGIIIVGDSDFITDNMLRMFPHNLLFFLNSVDYLTLDPSLIAIRSRGKTDRPLKELGEAAKNTIKFFNIFGVSVLVVAFGLVRFLLRKKVKKAIEARV